MKFLEIFNLINTIACAFIVIGYIKNVVKKKLVELELTIRALNIKINKLAKRYE